MIWLVRVALSHPYTFVVMAILIAILGIVTIFGMSTDILPEIDIPVVSVIWQYDGMAAEEMERRIVTYSERAMRRSISSAAMPDRKSTRLNSSHGYISYAVFCLKKKKKKETDNRALN